MIRYLNKKSQTSMSINTNNAVHPRDNLHINYAYTHSTSPNHHHTIPRFKFHLFMCSLIFQITHQESRNIKKKNTKTSSGL